MDEVQRECVTELEGILTAASAHLSVNRSESLTWPQLEQHMALVEEVLRQWSRAALARQLSAASVLALLLTEERSVDFWRLVDATLLPEYVELCLPQATMETETHRSACAFAHCRRHLAPPRRPFSGAGHGANASARTAVFRVEPQRSLLSENLRSGCRVTCSPRVLHVLRAASHVQHVGLQPLQPFRYVDVGAALGDCMIMASDLLPVLDGLSYEALPLHARLARATLRLAQTQRPTQRLRLRPLALGRGDVKEISGQVFHGGFGQGVPGEVLRIRSSTLDAHHRSAGMGSIDLLTVFVNHGENAVLDGAKSLLGGLHVGCVLVCTYGFANYTRDAMDRLHLLGYAAAGMVWNDEGLGFEWVKACPAPYGGTCCDSPFFAWWAEKERCLGLGRAPASQTVRTLGPRPRVFFLIQVGEGSWLSDQRLPVS
ncbi:unnamed protein product [Durusdinium trenchii]|uniref:Uncharacterized protein n=2 Tax=Durusdinium trenchii TaxID=1381693 RepID=A0ABP0LWU0_9DINO